VTAPEPVVMVHEASMVMRISGDNGGSTDGERKGGGK